MSSKEVPSVPRESASRAYSKAAPAGPVGVGRAGMSSGDTDVPDHERSPRNREQAASSPQYYTDPTWIFSLHLMSSWPAVSKTLLPNNHRPIGLALQGSASTRTSSCLQEGTHNIRNVNPGVQGGDFTTAGQRQAAKIRRVHLHGGV